MASTAPPSEGSTAPAAPRGLPPEAYETIPGDQYPPYVAPDKSIPELTLKAIVIGIILGIVFGAANAYLGLRVGLTVSASIPAAVMAIAIFRILRTGTILETNIVQTIGSAGESLAAGVIFTLPALYIWGLDAPWYVLATVALLGGLLGVLFMIPLRRFLVSREHGALPFPEGTATAEVQVAGEAGGSKAMLVFGGLGLGALYQLLVNPSAVGLWQRAPEVHVFGGTTQPGLRKTVFSGDVTPELLGVGFIYRPEDRRGDVGRRAHGLVRSDPADRPVRRWAGHAGRTREWVADRRHAGRGNLEQLRPLHRRGRGGGRWYHHPAPGAPADLGKPDRGTA